MKKVLTVLSMFLVFVGVAKAQQVVDHACWKGDVMPKYNLLSIQTALAIPYVRPNTAGVDVGVSWRSTASYDIVATISTCINGKQESKKVDYTYYGIQDPSTVRFQLPFSALCGKEKNWGIVYVRMYLRGTATLADYAWARVDGL